VLDVTVLDPCDWYSIGVFPYKFSKTVPWMLLPACRYITPLHSSWYQYNATAEIGSQLYTRRKSIPIYLMCSHIIQLDYIHPYQNRYVQNLCMQTKLNLPALMKYANKLQIGSQNFQKIAKTTSKGNCSQSGESDSSSQDRNSLKFLTFSQSPPMNVKHVKTLWAYTK